LAVGLGLQYGPAFQGLQGIVVDGDTISAEVALPDAVNADGYLLHPAALDVCFQALVCVFHDAIKQGQGTALLPVRIGRLTLLGDGRPASLRANLTRRSARSVLASFELFDAHGKLLAVLHGCRFQAAMLNAGDKDAVSHWAITPWLQPHPATAQHAAVPGVTLLIDAATHALQGQEAERAPWFTDALPLSEILVLAFAYEAAQTLAATTPDL